MIEDLAGEQYYRQQYKCSKCSETYHFRVPRPWLVKKLSFMLPVRRYYCARCKKKRYVWAKDE